MNYRLTAAVSLLAALIFTVFLIIAKPVLEPPGHKTRRDHMDQLDRIEKKIDELLEIGHKWE